MNLPTETPAIPDDLPVVLVLWGHGRLIGALHLSPEELMLDEPDEWDTSECVDYIRKMEELELYVREVPTSQSDNIASGETLTSTTLIAEDDPDLPEFDGTGAYLSWHHGCYLVMTGYTYGQVREMQMANMRLTAEGLHFGNEFLSADTLMKDGDCDYECRVEAVYRERNPIDWDDFSEEDLFILEVFEENYSCIVRSAPNNNFLSIEEVFAREPDWRPAIYGLIASMPSKRREHIFCCPLELDDALESGLSRGFISEIAP